MTTNTNVYSNDLLPESDGMGFKAWPSAKKTDKDIVRGRLLTKLENNNTSQLTLIHAPAGYGKSTLLSQWFYVLKNRDVNCAWLGLEARDNNPRHFISHLLLALKEPLTTLTSFCAHRRGDMIFELSNSIISLLKEKPSTVIFIDDLHIIHNQDVSKYLERILLLSPKNTRFLIATRNKKIVARTAFKNPNAILLISDDDLRFDRSEVAAFLYESRRSSVTYSEDSLPERLLSKTSGWAMGLAFASMLEKKTGDWSAALDNLRGNNPTLRDYFVDLFCKLPNEMQFFLLRCSVPDEICGELCDELMGNTDGALMIAEAEAMGLFISPMEKNRFWYKFHGLALEFLREKLKENNKKSYDFLQKKTALWYCNCGNKYKALDHAALSGDCDLLGDILNNCCDSMICNWELDGLIKYSQLLGENVLDKWPRLQLALAWALEFKGLFSRSRSLLDRLSAVSNLTNAAITPSDTEIVRKKLAHREMIFAFLLDDFKKASDKYVEWKQTSPELYEDAYSRAAALLIKTRVLIDLYLPKEAIRLAGEEMPFIADSLSSSGLVILNSFLAMIYFKVGALEVAQQMLQQELGRAEKDPFHDRNLVAIPATFLAFLYSHTGNVDGMIALLERKLSADVDHRFPDLSVAMISVTVRKEKLLSGKVNVDEMLKSATFLKVLYKKRILIFVVWQYLTFLEIEENKSAVCRLLDSSALHFYGDADLPDAGVSEYKFYLACIKTRLLLMGWPGSLSAAANSMRQWKKIFISRGCVVDAIRAAVLLVRLSERNSEPILAQRELRGVLLAIKQCGAKQLLKDEAPKLLNVLSQFIQANLGVDGDLTALARECLTSVRRPKNSIIQASMDSEPGLMPTSMIVEREIEILTLIGRGLRNVDVAAALGMTEHTVKWYLKRIYAKLGVGSRSEALRHARHCGLIA